MRFEQLALWPILAATRSTTTTTTSQPPASPAEADLKNWYDGFDVYWWLETLGTTALIIAAAWLVQRLFRRFIKRTVTGLQTERAQRGLSSLRKRTPRALLDTGRNTTLRRAQRAETIGALLRSAGAVIIFVTAFFLVLEQFTSAKLGSFVAGASIATAALAFGAQNIVRDFLAGFFIVVEDQYGVGDYVQSGSTEGYVESVSLRITRVRDVQGVLWSIPNGEIKKVGNFSTQWSRAVIKLHLALEEDIPAAVRIMQRQTNDLWNDSAWAGILIEEPEIWGPEEITPEGIRIDVAVKTRPLEQYSIARVLRSRIKSAFDAEGIELSNTPLLPKQPEAPKS